MHTKRAWWLLLQILLVIGEIIIITAALIVVPAGSRRLELAAAGATAGCGRGRAVDLLLMWHFIYAFVASIRLLLKLGELLLED